MSFAGRSLLYTPNPAEIAVTGVGMVTPFGRGWPAFILGLGQHRSGIRKIERFDVSGCTATMAALSDGFFDKADDRSLTDAYTQPIVTAAEEAFSAAGLDADTIPASRSGVVLAAGNGRFLRETSIWDAYLKYGPRGVGARTVVGGDYTPAAVLAERYGLQAVLSIITSGTISGLLALDEAGRLLREGMADVILVTGAEFVDRRIFRSLSATGELRSDSDTIRCAGPRQSPTGIVLGEAACALVLEQVEHARNRAAPILARMAAAGVCGDADESEGGVMLAAMQRALDSAGMRPEDLVCIASNASGTDLDRHEEQSLKRLLSGTTSSPLVSRFKESVGEANSVSGLLGAAVCIACLPTASCRPHAIPVTASTAEGSPVTEERRAAMVNAMDRWGGCAAIVFTRAE